MQPKLVIEYHYQDGNNGAYFIEPEDTIAGLLTGIGLSGNFQAVIRPATEEELEGETPYIDGKPFISVSPETA